MTFSDRAYRFYTSLSTPRVPRGVEVMNPYQGPEVQRYLRTFLGKYFEDDDKRVLILGINPGRFGAGVTGITFTDPVAMMDECGIPNHFARRRELSSIYVYDVINRLGGPAEFYSRFFLAAVCPLGFTRRGINMNYYDDKKLERAVTPFIVSSVEQHIDIGGRRDDVVILGRGDNAKFFTGLNAERGWFKRVHPVDHPRFIMQYRRKRLDEYVTSYERLLRSISR